MSYQSKKLWDEVLDNLDPKYANEAAELFGRQLDINDEEYGELVPVQAQKLQPVQSKKRIIGSIVGFAAAAAVLAVSVGAAFKYMKNDDIVQPEPNDSSVSEDGSTAEAITYKNVLDDIELPTDPSLYSEDFSVYEKYFCGRWRNAFPMNAAERDDIYYVGYEPADNVVFGDYYRGFGNELIGFYEDEHGAYMSSFEFMNDEPDEVFRVLIVFAPADDPDTLYLFNDYPSDGVNRVVAPEAVYARDGEYTEGNGSALNYFGVRKLCGEMGIDPELLFRDVSYDEEDIYQTQYEGVLSAKGFNVIVNDRGDDRLECAVGRSIILANRKAETLFYNVVITKENGEWGEPVFADRVMHSNLYDFDQMYEIPENTGEKDYAVLEEYFFGDWDFQAYEGKGLSVISTMYSDGDPDYEELRGGLSSVFRNDEGAFAFMDDGAVYFVPENHRQIMYYIWGDDPNQYMVYRLMHCATAESRDLYGELTGLGRSELFEMIGGGFEDAYGYFMEYSPLFIMNGGDWRPIAEETFIRAAEVSDNRVALVQKYYEVDGESTAYCVVVFEKNGGEWEYTDTYYDLDYDYTMLGGYDMSTGITEGLKLYEDMFFGEWAKADGIDGMITPSYIVCSYSDEVFGTYLPDAGTDGYYMSRLNGGAGEMFFIPYADTDSMYFYGEGTYSFDYDAGYTAQKRNYDCKYVRRSTQLDKELHDMMTISWRFGRYKLIDIADGNFGDLFEEIEFSDDFVVDKNGDSWMSGMYQGYAASPNFDPVLVSLGDDRIIISQTYYKPVTTDYGTEFDLDSTFENGMLKNFLLNFTKQDGMWSCTVTDAGESVDTIISFDMDMSVFPHFMGLWSNGDTSYTLDYYNDFFEPYVSWISGFEETDTMWLMLVHRVGVEYGNPVIPEDTMDTLFVIEKSDPDTVKLYRYENKMPEGDPQRIFTRYENVDVSLPDRGYISIYGLYALMDVTDTDGSLERVMREYCFDGSIAAEGGVTLYTDPNVTSKPEYVILERGYGKVKLATTFYSEDKAVAYDYIVTFGRDNADEWYLAAYEPAIYGLDGAEKLHLGNGSYYAFNEEKDGTHLYFYDSSDNIIYELDERLGTHIYLLDGDDLFVMDRADNSITRYYNGRFCSSTYIVDYQSSEEETRLKKSLTPDFLEFSGSYLIAGVHLDGKELYAVYQPYEDIIMYGPRFTSDYLEISENGFTVREDGELKFYDTAGDSLESVLPVLEYGRNRVRSAVEMDSGMLTGDINSSHSVTVDGLTYYRTARPMFPTFEAFKQHLEKYFTDECVEEILNNSHITNYNGQLYALCGAGGGDMTIAEIVRREVKQIDETNAELIYDIYRWAETDGDYPDWVMEEEPDESFSLYLEKTDRGWRFATFYAPY